MLVIPPSFVPSSFHGISSSVPRSHLVFQHVAATCHSSVAASSSLRMAVGKAAEQLAENFGGIDSLDMSRVHLRLEGLQSYSVITALLMNVVLRLFSNTPTKLRDPNEPQDEDSAAVSSPPMMIRLENAAIVIFSISTTIAVLFSAYTTIIFSLITLYSKRALGMGNDQLFLTFFTTSHKLRETGFHSFVFALASFKISFVMSLFLNYRGWLRVVVAVLGAVVSIVSWWRWTTIMMYAKTILFS